MQIELKRFTSNERLSQETLAYAADIYVNGKKAGVTQNNGTGGSDDIRWTDTELGSQAEKWIAEQPPLPADPEKGYGSLPMTVDLFFGLLADKQHKAKRDAATERKAKKFAARARTRGFKAFIARLTKDGSKHVYEELLFEAKTLEKAQETVNVYEKEHKTACFFMDEVTP